MFSAGELADLYADLGTAMIHIAQPGGVQTSVRGAFDAPAQALLGGEIIATEPQVRYATSAWPTVKRGDHVRIGAKTWRVVEPPKALTDGAESVIHLGPAA